MKIRTFGFGIFVQDSRSSSKAWEMSVSAPNQFPFSHTGVPNMKATARFTHEALNFERDNDVHLVVSLTAPKIDWQAKRPAVCILPCIDISGSMRDNNKLEFAKQSVLKLIDHLQPGDYCGLVSFESSVRLLFAPQEMTQAKKDELKVLVGNLRPLGGTNFSGGMLESLAQVSKLDLPQKVLTRVIMFTDGQANEGVATKREQLLPLLEENLGRATLSAFGYGVGADQDLLADLAKKGNGNYAFVKNPDDALTAFAKELGGLLSTYAQNIKIDLAPHAGHRITEVVSDVDSKETNDHVVVSLPDILSEEVRHLVFKVAVGKQPNAFPRAASVVDVKVTYECIDSRGKKIEHTEEMKGKLRFVKPGEEDKTPIKDVMDIVGTAILVQKQIEAENFAKVGDYAAAQGVMGAAAAVFNFMGMHTHATSSAVLGEKMANAPVYASNSGMLNSMKYGGTRGVGGSSYDQEAEGLLHMMNVSTSTAAQDGLVASFTGNAGPDNGAVGVVGVGGGLGVAGIVATGGATVAPPLPVLVVPSTVLGAGPSPEPLPPPVAPTPAPSSTTKSKSPRW